MDVREKLVELSDIQVLQREMECVRRKSATNCTDCFNCDLLMTDERILTAYKNAIDALYNTISVTVQEWKPISEPPKETGHYLVNVHQEDDEKGEEADFVLDAWYEVNGLLFVPKSAGWTLLNEWHDLTAQMLPFVTHWTERPQPPKGE